MILEPSDIAVDVVGDYFLIIDNDSESSYKTLKIDKNLSDKYSIKIKNENMITDIKDDLYLDISSFSEVNKKYFSTKIGTLKTLKFDKILRSLVKYTSNLYYKNTKDKIAKNKQPNNHIPPSGKVINQSELDNMIDASLDMWLTTGRFNDRFEKKLSEFLGIKYALSTNSGSSANLLAITALTSKKLGERQLKKGDEVITVSAGFPTTISPIIMNNLIPVFVDIELETYNINTAQIEEAITNKTKAIIIAHTLGNPFDLDKILEIAKKYNLWVIEDNCDALGSKYNNQYTGTFGDISTLSFYPAHHITMGEGGAVLTKNEELHKIIMSYRDWGRDCWCKTGVSNTCGTRFEIKFGKMPDSYDHKYIYSHIGYNLKITDWQASIALAQLEKLPDFIEKRKYNFKYLKENLSKFDEYLILPKETENTSPSWFGFLITVKENKKFNKNDLVFYLEKNNIGTRQLFSGNILRQPMFLDYEIEMRIRNSKTLFSNNLSEENYKLLPNSDIVMNSTFWIGVWPGITKENLEYMIKTFEDFLLL